MKNVNAKELRRAFGDGLSAARHERKIALVTVAQRSGIEVLQLNAFEAGTIMPELDDVYAIAAALDLHPAELLPVIEDGAVREAAGGERADELYPEGDDEEEDEDGKGRLYNVDLMGTED